jgi:DNA-binding CsgD family transcriptional regulator
MDTWPLVGRDEELALCERLLVEDGQGVVVVAPAGTGKTRLVQEAMRVVGASLPTETIVATRSAQTLPLAAVAALLPADMPAATEPLDLFRAVRRTLAERAGERALVIAIDDAQLLDPLSAALVHHLAFADGVRVLVAVRAREPVEDAIAALWRDGNAMRIDLQPLGAGDVHVLLASVLGGDVESATAWRLWSVAGGNPLYLREVVTEAVRVGTLAPTNGVWRWVGDVRVGARLRELVEARLAGLDDDERAVVALLAVGDHVAQTVVEAACAPHAIATLQQRGFVVAERDANAAVYRLDHPLFAEVVRGSLLASERGRWCHYLAESVDDAAHDDLAVLQRAVWQIEGGVAVDGDALVHAAERAGSRWDGGLGERLADAAIGAGAGDRARLVRSEARLLQGRYEAALEDAQSLDDTEFADDLLARRANVLAETGFWGLGRIEETNAALRDVASRVASEAARQRVRALESAVMLAAGRTLPAAELGLSIAADPDADPAARLRAVTAAAAGLSFRGYPNDALQLCETLLPIAFEHAEDVSRGVGWVLAQSLFALFCVGRLTEIRQLIVPFRDTAMAEGDRETVHSSTVVFSLLALSSGDLVEAHTSAREAVAALRDYDPAGYLPWALAILAQVTAQMGDAAGARAAVVELDRGSYPVRLNEHDEATGRAWSAVANGEVTRPLTILFDAARVARENGNVFTEGLLLHEALRVGARGRDVITRLEAACATGQLPCHQTFLAHAVALTADDGDGLDAVAGSFEQFGLMLYAAEAAAEAVVAHRHAGLPSRATRSAGHASRLLASCRGARTPKLALLQDVPDLTRREREVSLLAARGLSNHAIADRLGVSVRTVEGHLLRATTKLGVSSRQELEHALGDVENA